MWPWLHTYLSFFRDVQFKWSPNSMKRIFHWKEINAYWFNWCVHINLVSVLLGNFEKMTSQNFAKTTCINLTPNKKLSLILRETRSLCTVLTYYNIILCIKLIILQKQHINMKIIRICWPKQCLYALLCFQNVSTEMSADYYRFL